MNEKADALIKYRLSRAKEALEEAQLLARKKHHNACVNRLYYACFYAVSSLLTKFNLSSTKHTGVRSFFNLHFVKTGAVTKEIGQIYNDLFERRQEGDYEDFFVFEEPDTRRWIKDVKLFLAAIKKLIEK
jgi:uncharacterized protein (UPF0332 family)